MDRFVCNRSADNHGGGDPHKRGGDLCFGGGDNGFRVGDREVGQPMASPEGAELGATHLDWVIDMGTHIKKSCGSAKLRLTLWLNWER